MRRSIASMTAVDDHIKLSGACQITIAATNLRFRTQSFIRVSKERLRNTNCAYLGTVCAYGNLHNLAILLAMDVSLARSV